MLSSLKAAQNISRCGVAALLPMAELALLLPCTMDSHATRESRVPSPRAQDVIMGRGKGPETHAGNVAFLNEIAKYVPTYYATTSRKIKKQITWDIVSSSHAKGIRFLSRTNTEDWCEADEESVRVRVGQSLRYLYRQQQQELDQQQGASQDEPDRKKLRLSPEQDSSEEIAPAPVPDDFLHAIAHLPAEVLEIKGSDVPVHENDDEIDFSGDFTSV